MDFRHLRAFIAVAEESSITRAAERLHISQPPLSRLIRQLEDELNVTLFARHRQGVTLTDTGRHLLEKARMLSTAASDFFETASETTRNHVKKVRIGIGWGLWEAVNKIRVAYAKQFPGVTIEAVDIMCPDVYTEQLESRSLDVVFARPPFESAAVSSTAMFDERIVAVLSGDSPLASRKTLRIRDLASETLLLWDRHMMPGLYDKVLELYAKAGVSANTAETPGVGPGTQAGIMLVASGKGIYMCIGIPLTSPRPATGVAVVPVSDPDATFEVCVAWRKAETSSAVLEFLKCVSKVFPQERRGPTPIRAASRRAS
jgi:DNA-binding transcriptional LysR family regulator